MRKLNCCALILGLLWMTPSAAAPFAYTINSDGDGPPSPTPDQLVRIDLANGAEQFIGPVGFSEIESLAFSPSGELYGIDDTTESLVLIDTNTGAGQSQGVLSAFSGDTATGRDYGLSFACSGALFLVSQNDQELYRVDPDTAATTLVGATGGSFTALTAIGDELYALEAGDAGGRLARINPSQPSVSFLGTPAISESYSSAGLTGDNQGRLWAVIDRSIVNGQSVFGPSLLVQLERQTGNVVRETVLGQANGLESLAIEPTASGCSFAGGAVEVPGLDRVGTMLTMLLMLFAGLVAVRQARV